MRTKELIRLMPTQYKRVNEDNPLYAGHFMPLLGEWDEENGWVKRQDLEYNSEVLACPIVAVVDTKFGKKDCVLTITGKQAQYLETTETVSGTYTLKRKIYEDAGTTIEADLSIPRFTRPYATFLIAGLGRNIWGIQNVTANVSDNVGKISLYALASAGSKIIYWMGIHFLAEELREILRPWIAPSKCSRCGGTGIEPDTESTDCKQCLGYKYSGYSATKYVQRKLGFDVGLARQLLDWDNMTDADHQIVRKFISKAWTQKWWVTPTKNEILRLFAHFYDIDESQIWITERFNPQEPVWKIVLPAEGGSLASPFSYDEFTTVDRDLMKYIARSVTPAGVSVFVGFYDTYEIGDMEGFGDRMLFVSGLAPMYSSIEHEFELFGTQRNDFFNGWTEATDNFERVSIGSYWEISGDVNIFNANDMNRHFAHLEDNSYMATDTELATGISEASGSFELWVHPVDNVLRIGCKDDSGDWCFYIDFDEDGFYDNSNNLLTKVTPDSDYHLSLYYQYTEELHYKGTYDFEGDDPGDDPAGWTVYETGGSDIQVISELDGHTKVVDINDLNAGDECYMHIDTLSAVSGTVEFWVRTTDKSLNNEMFLNEGVFGGIEVYIDNNQWQYTDLTQTLNLCDAENDKWYRVKIDFECGDGGYKGLAADRWNLYVYDSDGVTLIDYVENVRFESSDSDLDQVTRIMLGGSTRIHAPSNYHTYYDAIGFTWDENYDEGDNINGIASIYNVVVKEPSGQRIGSYHDIIWIKNGIPDKVFIQSIGAGDAYIDAFGYVSGDYELNDNWRRLYEYGYGIGNEYNLTGVSGKQFDVRDFYYRDRFVNLNDY